MKEALIEITQQSRSRRDIHVASRRAVPLTCLCNPIEPQLAASLTIIRPDDYY